MPTKSIINLCTPRKQLVKLLSFSGRTINSSASGLTLVLCRRMSSKPTSNRTLQCDRSESLYGWHAMDISFLLGRFGNATPGVFAKTYQTKKKEQKKESIVDWVGRSLSANSRSFADQFWFADAYCIRNLIAHSGGRVEGTRAENLFERSRKAFANIEKWQDGYLVLEHEHVAEIQIKIVDFILETE